MEPLLSPDWYRVSALQPRLRHGVRVSRQMVRGEVWYVLSDPMSGKHHRFNDIAFALISACDGERTLDEVWALCAQAQGDTAAPRSPPNSPPTQGEALRVFSLAFAANLLMANVSPDASALVRAQTKQQRQRTRAAVNPLSFRVPLWNPDSFLNQHVAKLRFLFSGTAGGMLLALAALGRCCWLSTRRRWPMRPRANWAAVPCGSRCGWPIRWSKACMNWRTLLR